MPMRPTLLVGVLLACGPELTAVPEVSCHDAVGPRACDDVFVVWAEQRHAATTLRTASLSGRVGAAVPLDLDDELVAWTQLADTSTLVLTVRTRGTHAVRTLATSVDGGGLAPSEPAVPPASVAPPLADAWAPEVSTHPGASHALYLADGPLGLPALYAAPVGEAGVGTRVGGSIGWLDAPLAESLTWVDATRVLVTTRPLRGHPVDVHLVRPADPDGSVRLTRRAGERGPDPGVAVLPEHTDALVFTGNLRSERGREVYVVPLDGHAPPAPLRGHEPPAEAVWAVRIVKVER